MIRTDRPGFAPSEQLRRRLGLQQAQLPDGIEPLIGPARTHAAGVEISPAGARLEAPLLVLSGWVAELRTLSDGRSQIVGLRLPGDVIGLGSKLRPFATVALTSVQTADVGKLAHRIGQAALQDPMRRAWDLAQLAEQAQLVDHVVRLGRLSAHERTAHLLLELHERLWQAGLASPNGFHMPLTQETLSHILGLSIVHVNRTLQQLRREGLVVTRGGQVTLPDRERLATIANYPLRFRGIEVASSTTRRVTQAQK